MEKILRKFSVLGIKSHRSAAVRGGAGCAPLDPLVSCIGKQFTTILNKRFLKYAEDNDLISKYQAGFRPFHSPADNMFALNLLIEHMFSMKK